MLVVARALGRGAALAVLALGAVGCVAPAGGGGGGDDCREARDACSEGFVCVAVRDGAAYACRAACAVDEDCLRGEECGPAGICVDRPPAVELDAEAERPMLIDAGPPRDSGVRLVDAAPRDADVVIIEPADRGVDPGACAVRAAPADALLLGLELTGFEGFPLMLHVTAEASGGAERLALTFEPLTVRDRSPTGRIVALDPVPVDDGGGFETPEFDLEVPQSANQLGGPITLRLTLAGAVRGDGSICGVADGQMVSPTRRAVDGSVFAGRPWGDGRGDPFPACDGCLP